MSKYFLALAVLFTFGLGPISANATEGDGGIAKVEFFVDNISKGSATNPPFEYNWNTNGESIGNHTIKATSTDNSGGSASDEITVELIEESTGSTMTDHRDGQIYKTIAIGNKSSEIQIWFAENLNFDTAGSAWYNNSSANGDIYGRLYSWNVAKSACPTGWHLPSDGEWKTFEMALGMSPGDANEMQGRGTDEGKKLKSTTNWSDLWNGEDGNGTDEIGFNAQPGGILSTGAGFVMLSFQGNWWTSTEDGGIYAYNRSLYNDSDQVWRNDGGHKQGGFSVRCVKD